MSKVKSAPAFSLSSFVAPVKEDWYKHLTFEEAIDKAKEKMVATAENFVAMGYYLKHIWDEGLYVSKGYHNIWDCAEAELHISQATASRYINICKKFSRNGDSPFLDDRYKEFGKSQLQELLSISDTKLIERIKPDMSVKQIKELKKNKADTEKEHHILSEKENPEENSKELETYSVLSGQMEVAIDGTYRELNVKEDEEEIVIETDSLVELEPENASNNVFQKESESISRIFGVDDVIKILDNAWLELTKQYKAYPDESVRQTMNLLSKIIEQVKYEVNNQTKTIKD